MSLPNPEQELADFLASCYADPLKYVMGVFPWDTDPSIQMVKLSPQYAKRFNSEYGPDEWACEFLDELGEDIKDRGFDGINAVEPIRYSTASGHGIGKSTLVAWLIKFILDTRPFAKGVVTANTSEQLRTKTWAEVGKWNSMSLTSHLWDYSGGRGSMALSRRDPKYKGIWRCDAQTARPENAEAFQGLHAANSTPFFIFDEASGIDDKIWEARAGGATDGEPMLFDFGNPTRNSGYFFENCIGRYAHRYRVRHIDSRNVNITNKAYIDEMLQDYGEESDYFKVKVRGLFPSTSSTEFIPRDDVIAAMSRPVPQTNTASLYIGVDVARFGDDDTVIFARLGNDARSWPYKKYNGLSVDQVVGKVSETIKEFEAVGKRCSGLFIDGGAMGGGVIDLLRVLGYNPIEVSFGGAAIDRRYRYRSDEMWGKMRDALKTLVLPNDDVLFAELTQRQYGFMNTGKIHLESKKDMKARGIKSPDIADALALTFAMDTAYDSDLMQTAPKVLHEYDPFKEMWNV